MPEEYEGEERRRINGDLAKLVGEAGVRLSILEDARTEMKGLKESVVILAEAIGLAPTAEEVEASARRFRVEVALFAAIVITLGGLLMWGQYLAREGTRCLSYQLFEHRVSNQASHDEVFNQFHIPIPPHRPLPAEPSEAQIRNACHRFLPKGFG